MSDKATDKVDMSGEWNRTREGRRAGVYALDGGGEYPVHGFITNHNGSKVMASWRMDGKYYAPDSTNRCDLIRERKPFRFERWCNVYEDGTLGQLLTHEKRQHATGCIACVRVIIEGREGDGLDKKGEGGK